MAKRNAGYEARKARLADRRAKYHARVISPLEAHMISAWAGFSKYIPAGRFKNIPAGNR